MKKKAFEIVVENGMLPEKVTAELTIEYCNSLGFHHIALNGKATSETGYRSHFFQADFEKISIKDAITSIVEEISNKKVTEIVEIITEEELDELIDEKIRQDFYGEMLSDTTN